MRFQDYYATLGVSKSADDPTIKKAYRELARKLHPDVNKKPDAEERFKAVNEAYQVLSDPDKRARYDRFGADWEQYQTAGTPGANGDTADFADWFNRAQATPTGTRYEYRSTGGEGFSDFFETLFGSEQTGRRRRRQPRRGEDHEYPVEVPLREAFSGTTRQFELQVPEPCPTCHGSGLEGGGICYTCGGTGSVPKRTKIEVTIPAGIREGQKVRVAGQGGPGQHGGPRGDIFLKARIKPDSTFALEHNDLKTDVEVPLYTALLGGEVVVPTMTGRVALTIPPETQNGRVFRLRGQGWPAGIGAKERGDLLARVQVKLPSELSAAERDAFEQLRDMRAAGKPSPHNA